jgi:hypothetical protein
VPNTDTEQTIQLLKDELARERVRLAELELRATDARYEKILARTKVNIGELTRALAALGVSDI